MANTLSIQQKVTLKDLNTFGIETKADYFAVIKNAQELIQLLSIENIYQMPKLVLGEGSNVLFTKNYPGLVIKNAIKGIYLLEENQHHSWIKAGAGENWHDFVMYCVKRGYGGIENLSLIPGTVGAAPIQNIGAYGVELSDVFFQLEALNLRDSSIRIFSNRDCQFGYRNSIFKHLYKNQYVILSVSLQLDKKPKLHLDYGAIKETLQLMNIREPTIQSVSDAVITIRRSKLPDPKQLGNAGSFFKNPIISYDDFLELQKKFPQIPHFIFQKPDSIKLSAAWLIEQCGWKGKRFGDIGVYEKQALILVNYGKAKGTEILDLATKIQYSVQKQFGILLEPEVYLI